MTMDNDSLHMVYREWKSEVSTQLSQMATELAKLTNQMVSLNERVAASGRLENQLANSQLKVSDEVQILTAQMMTVMHQCEMFNTFEGNTNEHLRTVRATLQQVQKKIDALTVASQNNRVDLTSIAKKVRSILKRVEGTEGNISEFRTTLKTLKFVVLGVVGLFGFIATVIGIAVTLKEKFGWP